MAESTTPTGKAVPLLAVTIILLLLVWITTAARVYIRHHIKAFGIDDVLMCVGVINTSSPRTMTTSANTFRYFLQLLVQLVLL